MKQVLRLTIYLRNKYKKSFSRIEPLLSPNNNINLLQKIREPSIMIDIENIKGIIFDYGGTIDSNGKHWAEVIWDEYEKNAVPIKKEQFREAWVHVERYLATHPIITPEDNFKILLNKKINLQFSFLFDEGYLNKDEKAQQSCLAISEQCYTFARKLISEEKPFLEELHNKYPIVLVSNFYGNIHAVLKDFDLTGCFDSVIESAVVGVRKPNPAIFLMGVDELRLPASQVVVVGDSYEKDIVPSTTIGCKTIWLKGLGWEKDDDNASADVVITDFKELKSVFHIS